MRAILRSGCSIMAGCILAGVVIGSVEAINSLLYPMPAGMDQNDVEQLKQFIAGLPPTAFLIVLLAWGLGTFSGAWVAARLAGRAPIGHGLAVGVLFLLAGVANMLMIPHPLGMWFVGMPLFLVGGFAGGCCRQRK